MRGLFERRELSLRARRRAAGRRVVPEWPRARCVVDRRREPRREAQREIHQQCHLAHIGRAGGEVCDDAAMIAVGGRTGGVGFSQWPVTVSAARVPAATALGSLLVEPVVRRRIGGEPRQERDERNAEPRRRLPEPSRAATEAGVVAAVKRH